MDLIFKAELLGQRLSEKGMMMVTAESCTGGWISEVVTAIPGSSQWFERGFVTYTNIAKEEMLGVKHETLETHGAVSESVVREMVSGAIDNSHAQLAVAVSGIAGPTGGSEEKPVGTVWLAWKREGQEPVTFHANFPGDRTQIREQAVAKALDGLMELI